MPKQITYNEIKEYINGSNGNGCELLLDNKLFDFEKIKQNKSNTRIKLKIKCKCGNKFKANFDKFKNQNKKQCDECGLDIKRRKFSKTQEQFEKELKELVGDEYTVLDKYINTDTTLNIRHNSKLCNNYIWIVRPANIIRGDRCPVCSKIMNGINQRKTTRQYCEEIRELYGNEFEVINEYTGAFNKIYIKHNLCGNIFNVTARDMLRNHGCPFCNESKGEKENRKVLENNKINYKCQYSFDDLLSDLGNLLRFDFAIFDKLNNLSFLLEYDGEFHYRKIHKDHDFEGQVRRDNLKNEYCEKNNIDLLRIPYWDFDNIEEILNNKLSLINN